MWVLYGLHSSRFCKCFNMFIMITSGNTGSGSDWSYKGRVFVCVCLRPMPLSYGVRVHLPLPRTYIWKSQDQRDFFGWDVMSLVSGIWLSCDNVTCSASRKPYIHPKPCYGLLAPPIPTCKFSSATFHSS